jgi:hypothetical protein
LGIGQALTGLSLAYEFFLSLSLTYGLSNAIFLAWPGPAKSLAWPYSLFMSLLHKILYIVFLNI